MSSERTKGMTEYNINRGNETRERVIAAIEQCKEDGDISTSRVCEIANVHRAYFTKHPEMRKTLDTAIGIVNRKIKKRKQNDNSKDVVIKSLYVKIASLEKEISSLHDFEKYKNLYEAKCEELDSLKKQLDNAYRTSDLLNF